MKEILRKWSEKAEELGLRKWFRRDNLLILILSGVLLMIIALPGRGSAGGKREEASDGAGDILSEDGFPGNVTGSSSGSASGGASGGASGNTTGGTSGSADGGGTGQNMFSGGLLPSDGSLEDMERYTALLEERLSALLSSMEGVGEVRVMITLYSSGEMVLEKEQSVARSNMTENDGEGGSRTTYQVDSGEKAVYAEDGGMQTPFVVKTLTPSIEGVVVAAQGAGKARVTSDITEAVQALFGIEAHKVKVIRMKPADGQG